MISVILISMDRTDRLIKILESWANHEIIGEIIICDWSSKEEIAGNSDIKNILLKHEKIKIVRIDGQKYFNSNKGHNLAYRFTNPKHEYLLKIDADYLLKDRTLFEKLFSIDMDKNFVGGDTSISEGGFAPYCGFFFIHKKYFLTYNENLKELYGEDDLNLYYRSRMIYNIKQLENIGVNKYIYHIPHGMKLRYINFKSSKYNDSNRIAKHYLTRWIPQNYKIIYSLDQYIKVEETDPDLHKDNYIFINKDLMKEDLKEIFDKKNWPNPRKNKY